MKYFIHVLRQKAKYYWKYYVVLILQLSIGIAFISYALNHWFSSQKELEILKNAVSPSDIRIDMEPTDENKSIEDRPVTYQEYEQIKKVLHGNARLSVYTSETISVKGESKNIYYLYTDAVDMPEGKRAAYIGQDIYDAVLTEETVSSFLHRKGEQLVLKDSGDSYTMEIMPRKIEEQVMSVESEKVITGAQCIIFPLKDFEDNKLLREFNFIIYGSKDIQPETGVDKTLSRLKEKHGGSYQYRPVNPLDEQTYYFQYVTLIPLYLGKLAVIMMLVLIFGFTGVLYLYTKRREKGFAVCNAMGAGHNRICMEFVGEVMSICFMGVLAGNILSYVIMQFKVFDDLFSITFFPKTVFITIILAVIISVIVSVVPALKIKRLKPAELLRSL